MGPLGVDLDNTRLVQIFYDSKHWSARKEVNRQDTRQTCAGTPGQTASIGILYWCHVGEIWISYLKLLIDATVIDNAIIKRLFNW